MNSFAARPKAFLSAESVSALRDLIKSNYSVVFHLKFTYRNLENCEMSRIARRGESTGPKLYPDGRFGIF